MCLRDTKTYCLATLKEFRKEAKISLWHGYDDEIAMRTTRRPFKIQKLVA